MSTLSIQPHGLVGHVGGLPGARGGRSGRSLHLLALYGPLVFLFVLAFFSGGRGRCCCTGEYQSGLQGRNIILTFLSLQADQNGSLYPSSATSMQAAAGLSYAAHSHHHSPINQSAAAAAAMNPYAASSTLLASQVKIRQIVLFYFVLTSFYLLISDVSFKQ